MALSPAHSSFSSLCYILHVIHPLAYILLHLRFTSSLSSSQRDTIQQAVHVSHVSHALCSSPKRVISYRWIIFILSHSSSYFLPFSQLCNAETQKGISIHAGLASTLRPHQPSKRIIFYTWFILFVIYLSCQASLISRLFTTRRTKV